MNTMKVKFNVEVGYDADIPLSYFTEQEIKILKDNDGCDLSYEITQILLDYISDENMSELGNIKNFEILDE